MNNRLWRITVGFFILIVLFFGAALLAPKQITVSESRPTEYPINRLFDQVNNTENWHQWMPWLIDSDSSIHLIYSKEISSIGAAVMWENPAGQKGSLEISEIDPPYSILLSSYTGSKRQSTSFWQFESTKEGNFISCQTTIFLSYPFNIMGLFMTEVIEMDIQSSMANLEINITNR